MCVVIGLLSYVRQTAKKEASIQSTPPGWWHEIRFPGAEAGEKQKSPRRVVLIVCAFQETTGEDGEGGGGERVRDARSINQIER